MTVRRSNSEIERLERENIALRRQLDAIRTNPGDMPNIGCGDSSCFCAMATGMHTNAGCRCDEQRLRRAVTWWRRVAKFRLATIKEMKEDE